MQMLLGFCDIDGLLRDDLRGGFFIFIRVMKVYLAGRIRMELDWKAKRGEGDRVRL